MADAILSRFRKPAKPSLKKAMAVKIAAVPKDVTVTVVDSSRKNYNRNRFANAVVKRRAQPLADTLEQPALKQALDATAPKTTAPKTTAPATTAPKTTAPKTTAPAPSRPKPKSTTRRKLLNLTQRDRTKKLPVGITRVSPDKVVHIGAISLEQRLGAKQQVTRLKMPAYYQNNREIFVNFINGIFQPYRKQIEKANMEASCDSMRSDEFSLLAHQLIVRDYLNLYTPYRGLLLYHGLGSGKTCASVAVAEGIKESKKVFVMLPASLKRNYIEEIKKCGDVLYTKTQFWEFIPVTPQNAATLSHTLQVPQEFIRSNKINGVPGAWLVNVSKEPNFAMLNNEEKASLDKQLDLMIENKYRFISYNGLSKAKLVAMTKAEDGTRVNPFDDSVVVVDEAHNLVSMIVNKLGKEDTVPSILYELLQSAERARIVLLSGTPIINYPNELAVLFNILRGFIKTWKFTLRIESETPVTEEIMRNTVFKSDTKLGRVADYIKYTPSTATLEITRNPFGFTNKTKKGNHDGVKIGAWGNAGDAQFIKDTVNALKKAHMYILTDTVELNTALPDKPDEFKRYFIDENNTVKNLELFKRRIVGLASYFPDMYRLMPLYRSQDFHVIKIPMSDFQFGAYEEMRAKERKQEVKNAQRRHRARNTGIFEDTSSTYRMYSRAFCNFVFPAPGIKRPFKIKPTSEEELATAEEDMRLAEDGPREEDAATAEDADYNVRLRDALAQLEARSAEFLSPQALETYSPKFLRLLEQLQDPELVGLHLIYSNFRTVEGIGVLKLILEANGFAEFKVRRQDKKWTIDIPAEDRDKPRFALYTGTETPEEKEIVRNVFNSDWHLVPPSLVAEMKEINPDNILGSLIKVFMITAAGAEGISLKNTRYVHIVEPHWHPVRIEQVIGRARRICSHQALPEALRTVEVYLYLMEFSAEQLENQATIELRMKDVSKADGVTPLTSDEALYEIANMKAEITRSLLRAIREASIDCNLHHEPSDPHTCLTFGSPNTNQFSFLPNISGEEGDAVTRGNMRSVQLDAIEAHVGGVKYAYVASTKALYDWDSYKQGRPQQIGYLRTEGDNYIVERLW